MMTLGMHAAHKLTLVVQKEVFILLSRPPNRTGFASYKYNKPNSMLMEIS